MDIVTKVESYAFAGKLYDTELKAVDAALNEIGTRLVKEHHHAPGAGLVEHGAAICELIGKRMRLTVEPEVTSEKKATLQEIYNSTEGDPKTHADVFMSEYGFDGILDFCQRAQPKQKSFMRQLLDGSQVALR